MFTIKLYTLGGRQRILSAESFTVLRDTLKGEYEITLHQKDPADDCRYDIKQSQEPAPINQPPIFDSAIIENANGKTTEIFNAGAR